MVEKTTTKRENLYEGMYIISATLSDDARKKALEKIRSEIEKESGEVKKVFEQGRCKLAYEIDSKKEGYYYLIYFTFPTDSMKELWREYSLNEDLIRFMNLRVDSVPETVEFKPLLS